MGLSDFAVCLLHLPACTPSQQDGHYQQDDGGQTGGNDLGLCVVQSEVLLELVLDADHVVVLPLDFLCVERYGLHVVGRYHHALQVVLTLVGLAGQNVKRQAYDLLAVGGVDTSASQSAFPHGLNALVWSGQSVDANYFHLLLHLQFGRSPIGTAGHEVTVAEHDVRSPPALQLLRHDGLGVVVVPVTVDAHIFHLVVPLHGLRKTLMAVLGGRCAQQGRHFEDDWLAPWLTVDLSLRQFQCIASRPPSRGHVVAAYEGRLVFGASLAVEENHGDAFLPRSCHGPGHLLKLIRCHDQQVYAGLCQAVNMLYLQRRTVIAADDVNLHVMLIEMLGCQHLAVQLPAPVALRTLRYGYVIGLSLLASIAS